MHKRLVLLGICVAVALGAVALKGVSPAVGAGGGTISGRIVNDLNGDGVQQPNEPGLSGWRVILSMESGDGTPQPTIEATTDSNGRYHFDGLGPQIYQIWIPCDGQPHLWMATSLAPSTYSWVQIDAGADPESLDFLLKLVEQPPVATGSISGRLTWDQNRNAQPDASEPGAAGWTVDIGMSDAPQCFPVDDMHVTTSSDGAFTVSGLMAGTYVVSMASPPQGSGALYVLDYPGSSQQNTGWEAFYFEAATAVPEGGTGHFALGILDVSGTASMSGDFYWDQDQNGVRGTDEPLVDFQGFVGIMVRTPMGFAPIYGPISIAVGGGRYSYSGLAAGDYDILIRPPVDVTGGYDAKTVTLAQDAHLTGLDFGLWSAPGQPLPTAAPGSSTPTTVAPMPVASTPPATGGAGGGIQAPNTGGGPRPAPSDAFALPFALAFLGGGALALTVCAARRRRS